MSSPELLTRGDSVGKSLWLPSNSPTGLTWAGAPAHGVEPNGDGLPEPEAEVFKHQLNLG